MSLAEIVNHLNEACKELKKVFGGGFKGLVLFGSWARGEGLVEGGCRVF